MSRSIKCHLMLPRKKEEFAFCYGDKSTVFTAFVNWKHLMFSYLWQLCCCCYCYYCCCLLLLSYIIWLLAMVITNSMSSIEANMTWGHNKHEICVHSIRPHYLQSSVLRSLHMSPLRQVKAIVVVDYDNHCRPPRQCTSIHEHLNIWTHGQCGKW